jgi:hypothetical protein
VRELLDDKNKSLFNDKFPLIFKDISGKTPIDVALESNLLFSVSMMLDYIVKY